MVHTPRDFIKERLGGTEAVAEKVGRRPAAVRMWVHRGRVPRSIWPDLLDAYPDLTLDELKALEAA